MTIKVQIFNLSNPHKFEQSWLLAWVSTEFTKLDMGLVVLEKKMSVLINFVLQNTNLVSVSPQILLVMSDRTDEFRELCVYMYYVPVHVSPLKLLIMYYMSVMYKRSAFFPQLSLPVKMTTTI